MLLRNTTAYLDHTFKSSTDIRLQAGRIAEIGSSLPLFPGEELFDCAGDYVIPGFVDVHIHAFRGNDAMHGEPAVRTMARDLRAEGVAAFCPTTMSASEEDTLLAMSGIRAVRLHPGEGEALVIGAHMEAPFLSEKKAGAQRKEFFTDPSLQALQRMTGGHLEDARLLTMAPERAGAESFIRQATAAGLIISLGHTAAPAELVHQAGDWGANHITHTFNAQTPLNHREPGVPGAALTDDRFYTEMICDGIHLHRDTIRLIARAKGSDKAVVITDAMEAAGMPDGEYSLGGQKVFVREGAARLADGTLAGSVLLMRVALQNLIHRFDISPEDAVRMCTETPADSVGEKTLGRLLPGALAPVTRWTRDWAFVSVLG